MRDHAIYSVDLQERCPCTDLHCPTHKSCIGLVSNRLTEVRVVDLMTGSRPIPLAGLSQHAESAHGGGAGPVQVGAEPRLSVQ